MICGQCGAGLTPEMVKGGACGFCGTATEGLGTAHVEQTVDNRVRQSEEKMQRELDKKLEKKIAKKLKDQQPSAVTVAAAEAGRYTAAKIWGCGAGCLSTIGSLVFVLLIIGASIFPQLLHEFQSRQKSPPASSQPSPHPAPHPAPNRKKRSR